MALNPDDLRSSRLVFDLGTAVLKVDRYERHWAGGCAEEIATWENADPLVRSLLCPILGSDPEGRWLVMAKCEPMDLGDYVEFLKVQGTLEDAGILDQTKDNIMRLADESSARGYRLVSVDYACSDVHDGCDCPECSSPRRHS